MESLLSRLRMHRDHEPANVGRARHSVRVVQRNKLRFRRARSEAPYLRFMERKRAQPLPDPFDHLAQAHEPVSDQAANGNREDPGPYDALDDSELDRVEALCASDPHD